jgi:3-hydroxyisobutyrate dehydrogenase-like beta-hydroxyacid dehydrogenase
MQITIIGAGNMARGIATRALAGGHTARIIDRAPDKAARLAAGPQENAAAADVQAAGATGTGGAGIVVLALPTSPARNRHLAADAGPGARSLASVMRFPVNGEGSCVHHSGRPRARCGKGPPGSSAGS